MPRGNLSASMFFHRLLFLVDLGFEIAVRFLFYLCLVRMWLDPNRYTVKRTHIL